MPLKCNINAAGKRTRLLNGIFALVLAIGAAAFWAWPSGSKLAWGIVILLAMVGGFCIFEARAGWCALRAMGIKTRI